MNVLLKELFSNTILFAISNLGSKILVFFMVPFYTYIMTPSEFGVAGIIQTTATLLVPLLTLQVCDAVLKYSFEKDADKSEIFSLGLFVCVCGFLLSVIITPVVSYIPLFNDLGKNLFFIPLIVGSTAFYGVCSYFARSIDYVRASAIGGVLDTLINIVMNLFLLWYLRLGVKGFLLSCVIADAMAAAYIFYTCSLKNYVKKECRKPILKKMMNFSIPLIPAVLSWWLLNGFNNYYIMSVLGAAAVGIYTATLRVPSVLVVLSNVFSQAWLLSALQNYGTPEGNSFIRAMHKHFFSILLLLTGAIILLSHLIADVMLSGEFAYYWDLTPFLFVSVFYSTLVGFYGSLFSAGEKTVIQFVSSVIGTLLSIGLIVFFLADYGLVVVSFATMLGNCLIWVVRKFVLDRYIDLKCPTIFALLYSLVLVAMAYGVMKGEYIFSLLLYIGLVVLKRDALWKVSLLIKSSTSSYINNKRSSRSL